MFGRSAILFAKRFNHFRTFFLGLTIAKQVPYICRVIYIYIYPTFEHINTRITFHHEMKSNRTYPTSLKTLRPKAKNIFFGLRKIEGIHKISSLSNVLPCHWYIMMKKCKKLKTWPILGYCSLLLTDGTPSDESGWHEPNSFRQHVVQTLFWWFWMLQDNETSRNNLSAVLSMDNNWSFVDAKIDYLHE